MVANKTIADIFIKLQGYQKVVTPSSVFNCRVLNKYSSQFWDLL